MKRVTSCCSETKRQQIEAKKAETTMYHKKMPSSYLLSEKDKAQASSFALTE
jgi:hypothetical protein